MQIKLIVFIVTILGFNYSLAETAHIAVAANFHPTMRELASLYESQSPHSIVLSSGSSGKLSAQISHGAPYDLFFAADQQYASDLANKDLAIKDTQITYAIGKLALWSNSDQSTLPDLTFLEQIPNKKMAIANPAVAPYGQAAKQVLDNLTSLDYKFTVVKGENISQTYHFILSGAANLGFVAYSQLLQQKIEHGYWLIPQQYYRPIKQDSIMLAKGKNNPAAHEFYTFIQGDAAQAIILKHGYGVEL